MPGPDKPLALNLAQVIYRLMTNPRGWRVDEMMRDLGIKPRTYRKYRGLLQDHFAHLFDRSGNSQILEVKDGQSKYLRLRVDTGHVENQQGFLAHLTGHWFARQMFEFAGDTDLKASIDSAFYDFVDRIGDTPYWLGHVLLNTDRMLLHLPDGPKDYTGANETLSRCLSALFFNVRVRLLYRSASSESARIHTVCPFTLLHWKSGLYLIAAYAPDAEPYLFAIDRMDDIQLTDKRFQYPSARTYDPATLFEGRFGIYEERGADPTDVELIFHDVPWLQRYVTERSWHPTQVFEHLPDTRLKMTFTVSSMVEVWPWIRGFGDEVEVVSPKPS